MSQLNFTTYLKAGYPLLLVKTFEEIRAIKQLCTEALEADYKNIYSWDSVGGLYDHIKKQATPMQDVTAPAQPELIYDEQDHVVTAYESGESTRKIKL